MRLSGTQARSISSSRGLGNTLWDLAGNRPSLDLPFAESKSLLDATTGTNLIDFTRASSGTYVGSDGLIKTATTNVPRFDHDPTTGESLGLLVEEQRTNLLLYSEEFDEATTDWFQVASTIDSDAIEAPDGNNTADKLIATSGATEHHVRKDFSATAGTTYTFSCFLKAAERSSFGLAFRVAGVWPSGQNQTIEFTLTGNGSYSVVTGSPTGDIIALGNGWYRCHITATAAVTGTAQARAQGVYNADDEGIYLWGAQLEVGSFPTSYIPTTTSAVTRAADLASISGSNFSSWYRQDEGSFYVKAVSSVGSVIATADSGSLTRRKPQISVGSFSEVNSNYVESGTVLAFLSTGGTGTVFSHTTAYANNDYAAARDGGNLVVDTSGALPGSVTTLRLGRLSNGAAPMNGHIRRLTYFPTRLPNETLQTITQ